ncbi:MAG: deoxyhypusine synthase [Candidatus Aenigmatarchaeota archaeon]
MKKVNDISINRQTTIEQLLEEYKKAGGFVAKGIADGFSTLKDISRYDIRVLSFPACIVATGIRGLIKDCVKKGLFNLIITTCGTIDHDLARSFRPYLQGSFMADDVKLRKEGISRLGNIFVPDKSYGEIIEKRLQPILEQIYKEKKTLSTYELCWEIGKQLNKDSILYWAWKNKIPVIVPGITDGAVGFQITLFRQDRPDFNVDVWLDEKFLLSKMLGKEKKGALIVGGGISKHHVIWWSQFSGGLDAAVYVTTAVEWDGSLSGARTREAISWGKISPKAKHVTIEGDATVILPLLLSPFL